MNIRKSVDYTELFTALCLLVRKKLSQMELYCEIGRLISARKEKGAAVAAAGYLSDHYPEASGFSPRNLRRMREFYRTYEITPEILQQAMQIGWTQNVVILEADLSLQDKAWYIQAVKRYGWSKAELLRRIESATHTEMTLDTTDEVCYTDSANTTSENKNHDEDTLCVFGKHLPQSNGRVCDEESGKESRSVKTVPDRVSRNVCRRRASLSTCQRETVRTWDQLQRKIFPSAGQGRLRPIRPPDRHGQSQSCDDDPYVWQRPGKQIPSAAGLYRSSQRY